MIRIEALILVISVFSTDCYSQDFDENIVLINVGKYDKGRIARQIEVINKLNPRVVSFDIAFPEYLNNVDDRRLAAALNNCKKLVLPSEIHYLGMDYYNKEIIEVALTCPLPFDPPHAKAGFVSTRIDKKELKIPDEFIVSQKSYGGDVYYHFSLMTAMEYDSSKAISFIKRNERNVSIITNFGKVNFRKFSYTDVIKERLTKKDIEGKIVMFGFLGPGDYDKFFSPLNTDPTKPDIYGLEYLAHIVSQILEE